MKSTELTPAVKATIKKNWKSKNRISSELVAYLILTKNNETIEKSFRTSKCKNSYNKTSLVHALLNIDIEKILNDLLINTNLTINQTKEIKDYMKHNITKLLLSHLGKMNTDPIYKANRIVFKNYWKRYVKTKKMNNVSFLLFTLLNKDNILKNLNKAFPAVKNENKKYIYAYNNKSENSGLMRVTEQCRSLPSVYYRLLNYNLQKTVLTKILPNLHSTIIYEEKK